MNIVHEIVPADPDAADFRLATPWAATTHVGDASNDTGCRIDGDTARRGGAKTDVYTVFKSMLKADDPPNDFGVLLPTAKKDNSGERIAALREDVPGRLDEQMFRLRCLEYPPPSFLYHALGISFC